MAKISAARLDMEGGRLDNVQLKHYGEYLATTTNGVAMVFPAKMSEKVWSDVAAGVTHGAAVTAGGQLWAWGQGTSGQLGQITGVVNTSSPVQVGSDKRWTQVGSGDNHLLGLTTGGELWTWGLGASGQMARITTAASLSSPVQVSSDKTWASVSGGSSHSAAITTAGALWAWGLGTSGQLGLITTATSRSSPVQVASDKTWSTVSAGGLHTAAITTAGALWTWGNNAAGQLAQITGVVNTSSPVQVASDKTWATVTTGASHTAAITTAGALWAWGLNSSGQLARITGVANTSSPVQISSDKTWASVASNVNHILGVTTAGELWAWGLGTSSQLGDIPGATSRSSPVQIASSKTWAQAAGGGILSVGLTTSGHLHSWGTNTVGALGNPSVPVTSAAVTLDLSIANAWRIYLTASTTNLNFVNVPSSTNYSFTLFVEQDSNGSRQVSWPGHVLWSGGAPFVTLVPGRIDAYYFTTPDGGLTWFGSVGARNMTSVDLSLSKLWGWGLNTSGQATALSEVVSPRVTPIGTLFISPVSSVAAGGLHTAAVTTTGQLWTWGGGGSGQMALITTVQSRSSPVQVASDKTWSKVGVGGGHTAAITTAGALWAWGFGTNGQLAQITTATSRSSPVQISSDKTWASVMAGVSHTVAITNTGALWVWGGGASGQLGQITAVASTSSPVQVSSDKTWASAAAGGSHTAAITTTGQLWAWGGNALGQLASNTVALRSSPVQVASDKTWSMIATAIAASTGHNAAITTTGELWMWGLGTSGQLGNSSAVTRSSPVQVASDKTWSTVSAGSFHTAAITTTGQLWAWGQAGLGQTGIGFNLYTSSPVQIGGAGVTWSKIAAGYSHTIATTT